MITFLPSKVFTVCAKALDDKRLVGQVGEARIIYNACMEGRHVGHPAYDMWRPHTDWLAVYGQIMCSEHELRFGTPRKERFVFRMPTWFDQNLPPASPWWLNDVRLRASHIRALYLKDTAHYKAWKQILDYPLEQCCIGCTYWWPTHVDQS